MDVFGDLKKLGFGCMRLPMNGDEVDIRQTCEMTDLFLDAGCRYFDTAHGYISGKSETALRAALTSRYDRGRYVIADKLSDPFFEKEADIGPLFESQLAAVGTEYFDYFLIHCVTAGNYEKYGECRAFEQVNVFRKDGRVRHVGMSFHDSAEMLARVLDEKGEYVDFVQLQINYLDYDDPNVQGRALIDTAARFGKPVVVMEPVKGGALVGLPDDVRALFAENGMPPEAETALAFAVSRPGVGMVLSGMSTTEQMKDNIAIFERGTVLTEAQIAVLERAAEMVHNKKLVDCTACRYCVDGCPAGIVIPEYFKALNARKRLNMWGMTSHYEQAKKEGGALDECLECGACEAACPQHLPIRELLKETQRELEKK